MNNPETHPDTQESTKYDSRMICFGHRCMCAATVRLTFAVIAVALVLFIVAIDNRNHTVPPASVVMTDIAPPVFVAPETHVETDNLISLLKQNGLWRIETSQEVPRFFIESYPPDMYAVDNVNIRKKVFLNSLLPHALLVRQEALHKRDRLESILGKIDCAPQDIYFDVDDTDGAECSWSDVLPDEEINFIQKLCNNYRTTSAEELLKRVDAVPISIILAQGALESSWGSSRFTREGNSLFGMWTWKTKGIVPSRREEGKTHKVKVYDNVLESVRAYQLTLNRLEPYDHFRELRQQTDDPLILAEGLSLYSARGEEYVEDIKNVIITNNLQVYDQCTLSGVDLPEFTGPIDNGRDVKNSL